MKYSIAIVRALHLGDLLLAVPALRAIRRRYPDAEITLIGLPWAESFARRFSQYVDRFVAFPGWPDISEAPHDAKRTARFVAEQRAYGYDVVVQMHGNGGASNPFALALGGATTVGYFEDERPDDLTVAAPYPTRAPEVMRNLGLARLLGCPARDVRLEFPLFAEDTAEAAALLARCNDVWAQSALDHAAICELRETMEDAIPGTSQLDAGGTKELGRQDGGGTVAHATQRPRIGLHVGAKAPARRWPAEYFAALGDLLVERCGARILLTGGADEAETVQAVRAGMRMSAANLAGATTLGGLAALIGELDLFISNDTGPAHLAEAVGTPSVTIFGPAELRRWAPRDTARHPVVRRSVACSPCGFTSCPIDHRCLRRISPESVFTVATTLLTKGGVPCSA